MLWQSNICRICARISDVCIPIFQDDQMSSVEAKIRRCLNLNISKEDLKPKQVCQDCFVKLTEFYNFVALFHESNYRFEALLCASTQSGSTTLPPGNCINHNVNLDLIGSTNNTSSSKPEDIPDCVNLGLVVECKDDILPLANLDLQVRDFGEQNILNEIVGPGVTNNVDIDVQNFVNDQIYPDCHVKTTQNVLGKLRNVHSYLDSHGLDINLNNEFTSPEEVWCKSENYAGHNGSFTQNVYAHNIIINSAASKGKTVTDNSKKKVSVMSVEVLRKASESEKNVTFDVSQKGKLKPRKVSNNSVYKTDSETLRAFSEHNILNDIANRNDVDIDNIDVQNLVSGSDNLIYPEIDCNNHNTNLESIDNIQKVYLGLDQIEDNSKKPNQPEDPLAEDPIETIVIDDDDDAKNKKNRYNKVNIISVTEIRRMIEKRPLDLIVKKRMRLHKKKQEATTKSDENKRRFPCSSCEKVFKRRNHLNEHMKKHDSFRPFICEICKKTFAIQWDLTFHKRVHTDLYKCQTCSKCFSSTSKLERHVRVHTGEKPFTCPVKDCGRSFSDKRNLVGHQVTHTNVRKFICDLCKGTYKTKSQLKDHMQAHNDRPSFKCAFCDKAYKWKTNLMAHVKKHKEGVEIEPNIQKVESELT